jgi:hypothetical protein
VNSQEPKKISKSSLKLSALSGDRYLFSCQNIGGKQRDGDLEDFFAHENQPYPPSLSEYGNLRYTTKSDLLKCITRGVTQMPIPIEYDILWTRKEKYVGWRLGCLP